MQKQKREKINNQVILIVVTLILAVFLAGDLIGLGGNLRYYANWIMCGHKPLVVDHPFMASGEYSYGYRSTLLYGQYYSPSDPYFCTARDAELHGYSSDHSTFTLSVITYDELTESYKKNHGKPGYERLSKMDYLVNDPLEFLKK
ncbi:hypothetical protein KC949_00075 [Candidatus Saccharibacteria bacterium]|nr:hypothetical protein [Candidatus Saccharibacteria bacterium]